jgi:hypothetical protein
LPRCHLVLCLLPPNNPARLCQISDPYSRLPSKCNTHTGFFYMTQWTRRWSWLRPRRTGRWLAQLHAIHRCHVWHRSHPNENSMIPFGGATYDGGNQQPTMPGGRTQRRKAEFSNMNNIHNNWNVCFSCGFDIKDGHTSSTCPFKKWNHQDQFAHKNAQQFIATR